MRSRFAVCGMICAAMLLCAMATTGGAAPRANAGAPPPSPAPRGAMLLAATPPMGWNSWDGYAATINEAQLKATADAIAKNLKPFGWQYVVIDMGWYLTHPTADSNKLEAGFSMDAYGRFTPAANRFPSTAPPPGAPGADPNFKPVADYIHSLGLKFGIHILRGIPKQAVDANLPIANSPYHARDAADTSDTCPWNAYNYGLDASKPAAQAYYDSIASLYASWGVDFIKVDCIASHPYRGDEIRMLSTAIAKTGRPMVLSLSPGAAPIEKIDELLRYAQMWRISDDIWDLWHSDVPYPQGLGDQFANVAKWAGVAEPGRWPDADMLPLGRLGPTPGWGEPRATRLTRDEQRTLVTLWAMVRSPMMVGGDLTAMDAWELSLLTNPEVIAVDQHASGNRVAFSNESTVIWVADSGRANYVGVFNLTDSPQDVHVAWSDLTLPGSKYAVRDVWARSDAGVAAALKTHLEPHGCQFYELRRK